MKYSSSFNRLDKGNKGKWRNVENLLIEFSTLRPNKGLSATGLYKTSTYQAIEQMLKTIFSGLLISCLLFLCPSAMATNTTSELNLSDESSLAYVLDKNFDIQNTLELIVSPHKIKQAAEVSPVNEAAPYLLSNFASSSSFRNTRQSEVVYYLLQSSWLWESRLSLLDLPQNNSKFVPWFMITRLCTHCRGGGRLSGWKDSNLQYTANITYH